MTSANDPMSAWTRFWMDSAAQTMQSWMPAGGSTKSPDLIQKARGDMLQMWSDWCEQWLRSPAFLETQKQMLDGNLAVRKQFRAAVRRMQREMQLAGREDIDALEAAIRRSERRILDQLDEMSSQMQALEAKIDRLGRRTRRSAEEQDGTTNGARRKRRPTEKE